MSVRRNAAAASKFDFFDYCGINISEEVGSNIGARGYDPLLSRDENIVRNTPMVRDILYKMRITKFNRGYEDKLSDGILCLIQCIDGFDPSKGLAFSTYAYESIKRYVRRRMTYDASVVVPPNATETHGQSKNHVPYPVDEQGKSLEEYTPDYRGGYRNNFDVEYEDTIEVLKTRVSELEFDCWNKRNKDTDIAKKHNLSKQRIGQVRAKYSDDVQRIYEQITS